MTLSYTPRFKLAVPDFLSEPWHSEFAQAMESIDQSLYNVLIAQSTVLWANSTGYLIGATVINPDSGAVFSCGVIHTSSPAPQTFTQELIAHPTYWTVLAPTLATQAEAEAGVENTKYMSSLRTKQALSALSSATNPLTPHEGVLYVNSGTEVRFDPYKGNKIKINGVIYTIPAGGIAGLTNTNVFVSGVAGQNLAPSTTYLICAFNNGGVITGEFRLVTGSVTHITSSTPGNEGVQVLFDGVAANDAFTVIGICRTSAAGLFLDGPSQRLVRSWFSPGTAALETWLSATQNTSSNTYVQMSTGLLLEWVCFRRDAIHAEFTCPYTSAGATGAHVSIGFDSTSAPENTWGVTSLLGGADTKMVSISFVKTPGAGYHFLTPLYHTTGGVQINAVVQADSNGNRPTLRAMLHPAASTTAVS